MGRAQTTLRLMQVALLAWTHCVIGWGFFIFQFWIPTYLSALGAHNLESMGALSALPWAVSHLPHFPSQHGLLLSRATLSH